MSAGGHPVRTVPIEALRHYMRAMRTAAGCDEENADAAAEAFLALDLRGVGLQGLNHMPTLLGALHDGYVDGQTRPQVVRESPGAALIDGGRGPGQAATIFAVNCAIERACNIGSCTAAATNSFHLFTLGITPSASRSPGSQGSASATRRRWYAHMAAPSGGWEPIR